MIDLSALGLARDAAGIWRPRSSVERAVSFPADGHGACFEIEDDSFWFAHRNAAIIAALARHPFRGPLADIGGGNGAVSAALERAGIDTVVIEPGIDGARNARRRNLGQVVCATLEELAIPDGTFGAAGLFDVVEHVADDLAMLREVHRVLAPGGIACITVPAYGWLWSDEDVVAGHYRRYTRAHLRRVLEAVGFAVAYETYLFAALAVPVFVMRSLPHRLLRRSAARVTEGAAEHHLSSQRTRRVLDLLLSPELARIRSGTSMPVGTSCLAVAIRPD